MRYFEVCSQNKTEEIKEMLALKPELIYYQIPLGRFKTVFHYACLNNNPELFEYLYKIEPKGINFFDKYDCTPLFYAADTNNLDFFKRIISLGSDINHIDKKGSSVLYRSIAYSKSHMVEYILSHDVNVNIQSEMGRTPLIKASLIISIFVQKEED